MALEATLRVARKEFLENVLSWKFVIALVLSGLLLSTSVLVLGAGYNDDQKQYAVRMADMEEQAQQNPWMKSWYEVQKVVTKPNVLGVFVGGPGDDARRASQQMMMPGTPTGSASPVTLRFDPFDLGFVAVVVMTFMALIFAYDSVSGERERGTLKLMLANPVPKDSVLLGKYLGGMASVLVPFALAVVIGLAFLGFVDVKLAADDWIRLGVILGLFVLLVSAFFLVGLVVSSLARRSSTSLLAVTLVWLVLAFGVGNVAALAASGTTESVSGTELMEKFRAIDERTRNRWEELNQEANVYHEKMWRDGGALTPEEQARLNEIQEEQRLLWAEADEERRAILQNARRLLDNQLLRAEAIAAVSPAEAFRSLATAVAKSDYWTHKEVLEAAEAYQRAVDEARRQWDEDHGGVVRPTPVGSASEVVLPPFGEPGGGPQFEPPPFRYQTQSLKSEISSGSGVRDLLALVGYNLLAFLGAYAAFLRYDVR